MRLGTVQSWLTKIYCKYIAALLLTLHPVASVMLRAVTRRAFKTEKQLAASEAARWKLANYLLGWHEQRPVAETNSTETKSTRAKKRDRAATSKPASGERVAGAGKKEEENIKEKVEEKVEDIRPRKRAVVKKPRKKKVNQSISELACRVSQTLALHTTTPLQTLVLSLYERE